MSNYQDIFNTLFSSEYYKIKKSIDSLIHDDKFIKEIIHVKNPIVFDRFIKMCMYKMDTSKLCEERNKFIKKTILSLNSDNICDFFELNSLDKNSNEILANRYLIEYIVSYYFEDNYYNFMTNFYQMLDYLIHINRNLINESNINLYKEFVNLRCMSLMDKIGFFKLLLDNDNIMDMFYDDLDTIRTYSHKELVQSTLKLSKDNNIYQKSISERLTVDVYMLDGEDFFGFVRCFNIDRNDLTDHFDDINSTKGRLGYSFSYIGKYNIGTIDYVGKHVALYYDNINYRNIMYVHHADLHSKRMKLQDDFLSEKENEILTPQNLVARTVNYNEIYIKSDNSGIKPTALICYDTISLNDIAFAHKYDLSILLINQKKYKRYEKHEDDYDSYRYNI